MKKNRQSEIISILAEREIETQEELSECLRERGYFTTQATVSRDIRELKLTKIASGNGKYIYSLPRTEESAIGSKYRSLLCQTVEKLDMANNIVVVKTISGMASGAAAAIDSAGRSEIVGSVAGDDTVIIVMRTNESARALVDELSRIIDEKR